MDLSNPLSLVGPTEQAPGPNPIKPKNPAKKPPDDEPVPTLPVPVPSKGGGSTKLGESKIVAGTPKKGSNQIGAMDAASRIVNNPKAVLPKDALLVGNTPVITGDKVDKGLMDGSDPKYQMDEGGLAIEGTTADTTTVSDVATASAPDPLTANTYDAATSFDQVAEQDMEGAQGTVSDQAQVEAVDANIDETASGQNAVGQALNNYAEQDLNAVDARATVKGQMGELQDDFFDPETGEPKIPPYAQGLARSVQKTIAFSGMTGTAAMNALSTALMEASLPIAQQDAQFFQTLTVKNLDNKQQSIINKANVLANLQLADLDNRQQAAITNAKSFLEMDFANLNNDQQARVINTQARVQALMEDTAAENVARRFGAEAQNTMDTFYAELGTQVEQFNANAVNNMAQFNAAETNDTAQFNANLLTNVEQFNANMENQREQFEKNMAYNIDLNNANWRQKVVLTNTQMKFEAAAQDAKTLANLTTEALNQIWDRSDALLDYAWKSSEAEKDRKANIAIEQMKAKAASNEKMGEAIGGVVGKIGSGIIDKIFG